MAVSEVHSPGRLSLKISGCALQLQGEATQRWLP